MATKVGLSLVCCLIFSLSSAALGRVIKMAPVQQGLEFGPRNTAVNQGSNVQLQCVSDGVPTANLRWYEYVTSPLGRVLISDGLTLIESHPNRARYSIFNPDSRTFTLNIGNVNMADAGLYECEDSNAALPSIVTRAAQLIILESNPICNATYPQDTGAVVEGAYHTIQCIQSFNSTPGIRPLQTWTGPPPFSYGYSFNNNTAWSGISFFADRSMNALNWVCKSNFTDDLFIGPARDNLAPVYEILRPSNQIFVFWGPKNMSAYPIQASYEIGQTITCYSDAWPTPNYTWQSLRNSESWFSISFTTRVDMVGYQLMRCTAVNQVGGVQASRDFFLDVYVNPVTTPTTTPAPITTTPAPAWGKCGVLTGMWRSDNPAATVCLTVNTVDNNHNLIGLYKNGTDGFWLNLVGKTRTDNYNTLAWTAVFPPQSVGVSSYAAECHSCFGVEQILANGITRTTLDSQFCGTGGTVFSSQQYVFRRVIPSQYPCTASPSEMQHRVALNSRGKLMASQSLE